MSRGEEVDSFIAFFPNGAPGEERRAERKKRAKKEKRTQLSPKQRKRGGVRTTQINYRCAPAYRDLISALAKHLDCSIADVAEDALEAFADQVEGFKREGA